VEDPYVTTIDILSGSAL